ncbi:MAG: uroporphyrinogen-III C-methyltransferase [Betaproteobacteria bacterium]|nr:uroporphyrinogen-III C-methyltransferase [Betaproteobacteria bacterium]
MSGAVYLVGAGPGAPDLLTLRAANVLARADIVFHDALVHPDTLALAERAIKVAVGKRSGKHSTAQRFINKQLIDAAHKYTTVVRLKGGDPMLFGRAQEEIDALTAAGITLEIVPGVSAAFAASADLQVSLTRRALARSVVFATPREAAGSRENTWAKAAAAADTAVLYMAAGEAQAVRTALIAKGVPSSRPAVIVENASSATPSVFATTVGELPAAAQRVGAGPALVMVGEIYAQHHAQPNTRELQALAALAAVSAATS